MTEPQQPQQQSQQNARRQQAAPAGAPPRFVAGAIDLGDVKQRAQARSEEQANPGSIARTATVTPQSFEQDLVVRSTQVPVVLLIGSSRSPDSEEMRAEFGRLVEQPEQPTWLFRYVDVDGSPEIAQALRVQAVPTVLALAAGQPMTSFEGGQPAEQLEQWVEAVVQATEGRLEGLPAQAPEDGDEEGDPRFAAAEEKLGEEDYEGALGEYDAIIASEPAGSALRAEAQAARANVELLRRTGEGTADEIDRLVLEGRKSEAFGILVDRIRAGEDRDAARDRLLELFGMFDPADPEVAEARTAMASALF